MKHERKSAFVLCRRGLASILISSKCHVCYTAIKLIDSFSTSYFSRSKCKNMLPLNWPSHETTDEFAWFVRTSLMICESCESCVWNIGNHLAVKESHEGFVSDLPNHIVICRTSEGFVSNIRNHLLIHRTCEGFILNIRDHLLIVELGKANFAVVTFALDFWQLPKVKFFAEAVI